MIDIATESLFPLSELPDHWPLMPGGRRLHRSVGYRYASKGVGPSRVRLETVVMGSTRYTSAQAVQRFAEALTTEQDGPPRMTPRKRSSRRREAASTLDSAGIA